MKQVFRLEGLECANCAAKIERAIQGVDGVLTCKVNFLAGKMTLETSDDRLAHVTAEAEKIIKKHEPDVILKKI